MKFYKKLPILISFFYLFIVVFNDGFSSWYLAVPFLIYLIWQLKEDFVINGFKKFSVISKINLFIIILFIVGVNFPRENFNFFYPEVGQKIIIDNEHILTNSKYSPNSIKIINKKNGEYDNFDKIIDNKNQHIFVIEKKIISNHPDFSTSYIYELSINDKKFNKNFIDNAKKMTYINTVNIPDWYSYNNIYVSPFELKLNEIKITNFNNDGYNNKGWLVSGYNNFNFIFLYPFVYFPILIFFIINIFTINFIKNRKKKINSTN